MVQYALFVGYEQVDIERAYNYLHALDDLNVAQPILDPGVSCVADITDRLNSDKGLAIAARSLDVDSRAILLRAKIVDFSKFSDVVDKMCLRYSLRHCIYDSEDAPLLDQADAVGR